MAITILFCIFIYFVFEYIWLFTENIIYKEIIIIISPLMFYFSLFKWVNRSYFYDNWFVIKYFFRLRDREKVFNYSEIYEIKYLCTDTGFIQPTLIIKLKIKPTNKIKSFSFPLRSYSNRKNLLRFLSSKKISINIQSVHEKDQNILPTSTDKNV